MTFEDVKNAVKIYSMEEQKHVDSSVFSWRKREK